MDPFVYPLSLIGKHRERSTFLPSAAGAALRCPVNEVKFYDFAHVSDARGDLCAIEFGRHIPFEPKRAFFVSEVPEGTTRGGHAHRQCDQFLVCVAGSLSLTVDDGSTRADILLDCNTIGVLVPRLVWASQYRHQRNAIILVLASEFYDPADYLRDYDDFLAARRAHYSPVPGRESVIS